MSVRVHQDKGNHKSEDGHNNKDRVRVKSLKENCDQATKTMFQNPITMRIRPKTQTKIMKTQGEMLPQIIVATAHCSYLDLPSTAFSPPLHPFSPKFQSPIQLQLPSLAKPIRSRDKPQRSSLTTSHSYIEKDNLYENHHGDERVGGLLHW